MEGLEISEVLLSELERTKRIDSEFYKKENIVIDAFIKNNGGKSLTNFARVSDGNHMSISDNFTDTGIPYYRGQDVHNFFIEYSTPICIDENTYNNPILHRSHLRKGDVLLSIVGTIGKLSLVSTNNKSTCSCKLAILRSKNILSNELLSTFLACKYGQNQIKKLTRGAVQMGLLLEDMDQLFVPLFSKDFDEQIIHKIQLSQHSIERSIQLYGQAEDLLLEAIGLKDFQPSRENINIKTFNESFLATGRLDAEYYQPKYDEIVSKVKRREYNLLGNLVSIRKSIEPGSEAYSDEGLPFLRVADYNKFGISTPEKKLSAKFCNENRLLLNGLKPQKETILFSKDGSVGVAYMLRENVDFITSGAILHLTVKSSDVLPAYLTLALNSEIVRQQSERDVGGSIILHWRIDEIKNVLVPIANIAIQREIAALIEQSFSLRKESERLLNEAKEMVEKEIEQTANATQK